jgi:hypothetical protein
VTFSLPETIAHLQRFCGFQGIIWFGPTILPPYHNQKVFLSHWLTSISVPTRIHR